MFTYLDKAIYEGLILESAVATPYSVDENIKRGKEAMRHVISSHKIEPRAMYRKDIGWIGFEWGTEGETPPEFKDHTEFRKWQKSGRRPFDKGGHGISHIIAKRNWENKYIKEFKGLLRGKEFVFKLIEVIAKGAISSSSIKAVIKYDGMEAILWRKEKGKEIIWLVTGYSAVKQGYQYILESADGVGGVDCPDPSLRMNDDNWAGQTWERRTQDKIFESSGFTDEHESAGYQSDGMLATLRHSPRTLERESLMPTHTEPTVCSFCMGAANSNGKNLNNTSQEVNLGWLYDL